MKQLVSIIIPVYNCSKYISKCLDTIIEQSYSNIEIILVNDGSSDNSLDFCKIYKKKDKRIRIINNDNHGVSYSRNCGIKASKGDYICFIDADDWIDKYYIEKLLNAINDNDSDVAICNYYSSYNHNNVQNINNNIDLDKSFIEFIVDNNCWTPWAKLFKKEKIEKLFDINVSSSEDLLFNFMNSKNLKRYKYIDEPLYYYRRKDDNQFSISKVGKKQLTELEAIMYIINNSDGEIRKFAICHFISILHRIIFYDNKNKIKSFKDKNYYLSKARKYYKELDKKSFSFKKNIKLFIMMKFSIFYYFLYNFKLKTIKYK